MNVFFCARPTIKLKQNEPIYIVLYLINILDIYKIYTQLGKNRKIEFKRLYYTKIKITTLNYLQIQVKKKKRLKVMSSDKTKDIFESLIILVLEYFRIDFFIL